MAGIIKLGARALTFMVGLCILIVAVLVFIPTSTIGASSIFFTAGLSSVAVSAVLVILILMMFLGLIMMGVLTPSVLNLIPQFAGRIGGGITETLKTIIKYGAYAGAALAGMFFLLIMALIAAGAAFKIFG